jgi:hypothetical protein
MSYDEECANCGHDLGLHGPPDSCAACEGPDGDYFLLRLPNHPQRRSTQPAQGQSQTLTAGRAWGIRA